MDLAANLERISARMRVACARAGRDITGVSLLAQRYEVKTDANTTDVSQEPDCERLVQRAALALT